MRRSRTSHIFELQEEISRLVAARIATELGPSKQERAKREPRRNLGAWDLYQLVFVYVTDGALEVDVEGEERMTVSAGDAFYGRPDLPMVARTAAADEGARFIVSQVGPTGEPIMVPQPE